MEKRKPEKKPGRPKKSQNKRAPKTYTPEELDMALKILWEDPTQSVLGVAKQYHIPEATLRKRKNNGPNAPMIADKRTQRT